MRTVIEHARDRGGWQRARGLFGDSRAKLKKVWNANSPALVVQYEFQQICGKTLYNLTMPSAPFDPDSAYWVVPTALALARVLGVPESDVIEIVAGQLPSRP